MIAKSGRGIFDRALSPEAATLKKLQSAAVEAKDLQSAQSNLNIDGESNDQLSEMLSQLKGGITGMIENILQLVLANRVIDT